jgi:predicted ATPase
LLEVPESLQDSLMARLDRHAPIKALAQICSVIGREFSIDLLAAVAPWEPDDLSEALRQLAAAGLIFRRGVGPEAVHVFKHTLIRDVAYDSLLKRNRRKLHAQIARILEERFPQVGEAEPDLLAQHWSEAGDAGKAAAHYLRAGERALARSATAEAVALLTTGRDVLLGLPEGRERDATELEIQVARGAALSAAMGLAAPDVERAYARARELCSALGEERRLGSVLLGLWASHNARDELEAARGVAVELLELARRRRDPSAEALGRRALGATLFGLGQFADAREHLQDLVSRQDLAAGRAPAFLPYDPFVSGRAWLALTLAVLGYPEQAIVQSNRALADAAELRHHNTLCLVLSLRCSASQFLRDTQDVAKHADALLAVAEEQGFAYWTGLGSLFRGWAHAWSGEINVGIAGMRRGLEICGTTGARAYVPYNLALLGEVCLRAGDLAEARSLLDGAFARLRQTDARYCEAELLRIDAELRLAMMPADGGGAEDSFNRALKIAHGQQARTAELCAAMRLAKLLVDRGRQQEARDLLAPIYGWFTEGSSTSLISQAGQLADALG